MVKKFLFFFLSREGERGCAFAVFLAPFPEKGILDHIAHRPIIQVFTILQLIYRLRMRRVTVEITQRGKSRIDGRREECEEAGREENLFILLYDTGEIEAELSIRG